MPDLSVTKTGIKKIPVYDVETDGIHNFFANGILCHNSMYSISKVPELIRKKIPNIDDEQMLGFIESFSHKHIEPVIAKGFEELAEYTNSDNRMRMKLETISDSGFFLSAKHYIIRVRKAEGVMLAHPKIKMKGIEISSSSTPIAVKPALRKVIELMLDGIDSKLSEMRDICRDFRDKFDKMSVFDIGVSTSMNKSNIYHSLPSGTHIHIRGSIVYNKYLDSINSNLQRIKDGDRIKYVYLKVPNFLDSHVISFMDDFPEEILRFVDYEKQFDVVFLRPVNNKLKKFGYEINMSKINLKNIFKRSR